MQRGLRLYSQMKIGVRGAQVGMRCGDSSCGSISPRSAVSASCGLAKSHLKLRPFFQMIFKIIKFVTASRVQAHRTPFFVWVSGA